MSMSFNGTNGLTFNDGSSQATAATGFGFKNRIINGAMQIDQRNAGASASFSASATYFLDRFKAWGNISTGTTVQKVADAPAGFYNSLKVTVGTGATPSGSDYGRIHQPIEGYNFQDMRWGFSDAKQITISFWVKSSLTGTFGCGIQGNTYYYCGSYSISAANTWEYKTITITGYTSGGVAEFPVDSSAGVSVFWDLGDGPTRSIAANTWTYSASAGLNGLSGGVKVLATSGATWQVTGVQLEKGSTATSFDYRPYGTELNLCYRYYYKNKPNGSASAPFISVGGAATSTTLAAVGTMFPVPLRITPTALEQSGTAGNYYAWTANDGVKTCTAVPTWSDWTTPTIGWSILTVAAGLTTGAYAGCRISSDNAYLAWSAEL